MDGFLIRPMTLNDLHQVEEIEKKSFATIWSRNLYKKEITENSFAHYFTMEKDDKVIGFCGMWLVIDEVQITNIAVDPDYRGFGYGTLLFQHMLNVAIHQGAVGLSLEVRTTNLPAQRLYRKFGLEPAGIRKNYYTDNNEDAIVMWVKL